MKTVFHIIAVSMLCLPLSACLNGNLNWASSFVPNTDNSAQATITPTPNPGEEEGPPDTESEETPEGGTGDEEPGATSEGANLPFGSGSIARHGYQYEFSGNAVNAGDYPKAMVVHPDGRLIIALNETSDEGLLDSSSCALMAIKEDGSKDMAFGPSANGLAKFSTATIGIVKCSVSALTLQGTSILVTGWAENTAGERGIFLARVDSAGALDLTFGPGRYGYSWTTYPHLSIEGKDVKVDNTNRILVVASAKNSNEAESIFIARFDVNGIPDQLFGTSGLVRVSLLGWTNVTVSSFAIDLASPTIPILMIAGSAEKGAVTQAFVYAFDSVTQEGKSGFMFNSDIVGLSAFPALREAISIVMQDMSFVFAGRDQTNTLTNVVRGYNTTGGTDSSFGMMGVVNLSTESLSVVTPVAIKILADKSIVVLSSNVASRKTILDFLTPTGGHDSIHGTRTALGTGENPTALVVGNDFYYVAGYDMTWPPDLYIRRISF